MEQRNITSNNSIMQESREIVPSIIVNQASTQSGMQ